MREVQVALYNYIEENDKKPLEERNKTPFTHTMKIAKYQKHKPEIESLLKDHTVEYKFSQNEAIITA